MPARASTFPTLAEVLELVAGRLAVYCELKATPGDSEHDAALVDAVLATLGEHDALAWSGIHSFDVAIVERARANQPRLSAAIISPPVFRRRCAAVVLAAALKRGCQAISVHHMGVDADLVRDVHRRQLTLWTWTPDDEAEWRRLAGLGVDGIITNYPSRLRKVLTP
ncbi:MAG: glycerophosphodiester phosphodiesterase [Dehalococcoidia bacterium]|nr:glycerophosphodiester phosphodiesterase [Dehalococcoidia bacterium]